MAFRQFMPTIGSDIKLKTFSSLESNGQGSEQARSGPSNEKNLIVTFNNIQYGFYKTTFDDIKTRVTGKQSGPDFKVILRGVSGQLRAGEMTALMGPAGAGKSILLECILGKRTKGFSGQVTCKMYPAHFKTAYIPQNDRSFVQLTVRESIIFSSQLQNFHAPGVKAKRSPRADGLNFTSNSLSVPGQHTAEQDDATGTGNDYHSTLATQIMKQLGLEVCADTHISMCSGGQQKRLSIAVELVSRPSLLIIDEPTSGLDSAACLAVVKLLHGMAIGKDGSAKMAVLITIHQPAWQVFDLFDTVYMLSKDTGNFIYGGPPDQAVSTLKQYGLNCPNGYNPADYLTEVACGEEGRDVLKQLTIHQINKYHRDIRQEPNVACERMANIETIPNFPFLAHLYILFLRSFLISIRDYWLVIFRLVAHVAIPIGLALIFKDCGSATGCPPSIRMSNIDPELLQKFQSSVLADNVVTNINVALLFYTSMFLLFAAMMPTILSFPSEIEAVCKETFNNWYSGTTYYLAKVLAEMPFMIFYPFIYVLISYYINDEPSDKFWRMPAFAAMFILMSLGSQALASLVSVVFIDNPGAGVYAQPVLMLPSILFSGYFIRIADMSNFFVVVSFVSFIRFSFENALILVYGYGRCGSKIDKVYHRVQHSLQDWMMTMMGLNTTQLAIAGHTSLDSYQSIMGNATQSMGVAFDPIQAATQFSSGIVRHMIGNFVGSDAKVRSHVLNNFHLDDSDLWPNVVVLLAQFLVFRTLAYLVLYRRIYIKN